MSGRVIVTGANGFVGHAVCRALLGAGRPVTGVVRRAGTSLSGVSEWVSEAPNFDDIQRAWPMSLHACSIIHLAARVHVMSDDAADPLAAFRATNVEGALRVAKAAQRKGVRRFVYVSSIKAVAELDRGRPLRENDSATPEDAYGRSKLEAEAALRRFGEETGLEVVIVRPPLVYGPGVRANFLSLMRAIAKGIPLPLGALEARRSLIFVDNLADALVCCATRREETVDCFHVSDDESPTVAGLAREIGIHLGRPARLLPVPAAWLRKIGQFAGRSPQIARLTGDLRVDSGHIRAALGWQPHYSFEQGIAQTARWYRTAEH